MCLCARCVPSPSVCAECQTRSWLSLAPTYQNAVTLSMLSLSVFSFMILLIFCDRELSIWLWTWLCTMDWGLKAYRRLRLRIRRRGDCFDVNAYHCRRISQGQAGKWPTQRQRHLVFAMQCIIDGLVRLGETTSERERRHAKGSSGRLKHATRDPEAP